MTGRFVDPHPAALRMTPSSHAATSIKIEFSGFHNDELNCSITTDSHEQQLQQNETFTFRCCDALEGKQAKLYRQRFAVIAVVLPPTSLIYHHMCGTVGKLDPLIGIHSWKIRLLDE